MTTFFLRGENVPTIRYEYTFAQFVERLQNYAYKLACDVISDPKAHGRIIIKMFGSRMESIETDVFHISFYASHASFSKNVKNGLSLAFEIEEKLYTDSNHSSKAIYSHWQPEKLPELRKSVTDFIVDLMKDVKAEPRFSLKKQAGRTLTSFH